MYECPNCGGNLKFHIPEGKLLCAHCESRFEPGALDKGEDTADSFEANVFLCPQCGGRMVSGDNDATAFCSYCGAANILSCRISREKRPKYIIPFTKTKEDCKRAYARKLRKAFFAPKKMRSPEFIESFRGIYMPYWSYRMVQKGKIELAGKTSKRRGDYIYTDHYALKGNLDARYEGYTHDASSAFYDSISETIAPFDTNRMTAFSPAYLSGFYAETADVDAKSYRGEGKDFANHITYEKLKKIPVFRKHGISAMDDRNETSAKLLTECEDDESVMFPVWFLCYRNQDRLAYAAVNGQTGKVAVDLPVDEKRFFLSSLLPAVLIFLLLNACLTLRPPVLLDGTALLTAAAAILYDREMTKIFQRETEKKERDSGKKNSGKMLIIRNHKGTEKKVRSFGGTVGLIIGAWIGFVILLMSLASGTFSVCAWLTAGITAAIVSGRMVQKRRERRKRGAASLWGERGFFAVPAALTAGGILRLLHPVSDLWYYGAGMVLLAAVIFLLVGLIRNYNRLTMRPLPQFEKKGGDDDA